MRLHQRSQGPHPAVAERDRLIVTLVTSGEMTQGAIAQLLGLTRGRVSQIVATTTDQEVTTHAPSTTGEEVPGRPAA